MVYYNIDYILYKEKEEKYLHNKQCSETADFGAKKCLLDGSALSFFLSIEVKTSTLNAYYFLFSWSFSKIPIWT